MYIQCIYNVVRSQEANPVMTEKPKPKKKIKKDSQLVIRINGEVRDQFVDLCDELDTSAAREIRRFIQDFLREHKAQG